MSKVIAPTSIDKELEQLLKEIDNGTTQLPEFQRSWIWDDYRIRAIIASISQGYPMGVIMRLAYGNSSARFQYRPIEGADTQGRTPSYLILDGQQRLTSIYCAAYSHKPVNITNNRGKDLRRFYYLDINKCLDENVERIDAVNSVSDDKKGLETQEQEFRREMFPLNIIFDSYKSEDWADGYKDHHGNTPEVREKYKRFRNEVLNTITSYKLPVIDLDSSTSKEAVCKVFENVNTGGVVLTVFELVTASFAADDFNLREDWEKCKAKIRGSDSTFNTDLMDDVNEVSFLTAITLYSTFMNPEVYTSCARKDVLNLTLEDYLKSRNTILEGYELAKKFLFSQCIFRQKNLPYSLQLTILAAICAVIGKENFNKPRVAAILTKWFWCGVLGELYGNLTQSSYRDDIEDIPAMIKNSSSQNRVINKSFFSATRLMTLKTRTSAAYKGIMNLFYREGCRDLVSGTGMDVVNSMNEALDVHHIFPKTYCKSMCYSMEMCDSIVNKTPLLAASNRAIGGNPPSVYSAKIMRESSLSESEFRKRVESNLIDYDAFISDDFKRYFVNRAKRILLLIEKVMGKPITDKDSEQTIELFRGTVRFFV